jgi:hypothetical protein
MTNQYLNQYLWRHFFEWVLNRCWPFSTIRRLQRELAFSRSVHTDYVTAAEQFYSLFSREIPHYVQRDLWRKFHAEAELELARIGAMARVGRDSEVVSPEKTGRIDPKLGDIVAGCISHNEDRTQEMRQVWERGGPVTPGEVYDISAPTPPKEGDQ